jgi:hypothetical protein
VCGFSLVDTLSAGTPTAAAQRLALSELGEGMGSYFSGPGQPQDDDEGRSNSPDAGQDRDMLPYRVEVWDPTGTHVEQVIALTRNRNVGWAAYFATTEQFPARVITFRDQYGELGRWTAKKH